MPDVVVGGLVDGAIFAGAVWVIVRALPRLTPGVRATLWWLAAARFVIALISIPPVQIPILPADGAAGNLSTIPRTVQPSTAATALPVRSPDAATSPGMRFVLALWAAGVLVSLGRDMRRWSLRQRTVRSSIAAGPDVQGMADEVGRVLRLGRVPAVRISTTAASPLITGLVRPVILLPAERLSTMSIDELRMALCHELAHLKRGDLWLGLVPAAAERLFFFHPLARLAAREYVFWREVACDRTVLEALGTPPQSYGRLLLDLGVASERATLAPAGAAWSFSSLKRRIVMLQRPTTPTFIARVVAASAVTAAIIGLLPFKLAARPSASAVLPPGSSEPTAQSTPASSRRDEIRFVFLTGEHTTMSGSTGDIERARRLRTGGEDLLWFRKDGREFVVRDPDVLREVRELWTSVSRIGAEQGEVGAKQGEIGARQGAIGARQGEVGAQQAAIGSRQAAVAARQAELAARQARRSSESERTELDRNMRALDDDMRALDREMQALNAKMRELGKPMEELGKEMEVLGREMEALGAKMERESEKAEAGMRRLMEKAIASGAAQPVR